MATSTNDSAKTETKPMRQRMTEYILDLQERIVTALEGVDASAPKFKRDSWTRAQGGYGTSCVFASPPSSDSPDSLSPPLDPGKVTVLEKGGVNISVVHGMLPPSAIKQMVADHSSIPFNPNDPNPKSLPFFAAGISLVIHPRNPSAPTVHANYRYFELTEPDDDNSAKETVKKEEETNDTDVKQPKVLAWWFGGGADLTPSYFFEADTQHFHKTLKSACEPHGSALHPAFKSWCDEYFFITHRGESRGIGGIFFDDLSSDPHKRLPDSSPKASRPITQEEIFAFVRSCGDAFIPSYIPILERRKDTPWNPHMRRWQLLRRGRYVEFNLVYDRGTKFGLMTPGARVESILMSLPETARWEYMSEMGTEEGTEEAKLLEILRKPRDWA
ncbi:coproporphyrinogen III oxidase [Fomitiporia mediterranea MF3/22]|uniref:coproporphyrinogen III oxidase n=1 Tax=Fomitiporia mediterranea (strain MF3/22) TaxID=694068 RepID=UPI00044073FF|nr:coproporphyrinogen III oxidase [Fomitiporia mediterranea MF3/22]EJC98358.1 coproporphyrinogen III oxidase [Fomitiporia mediterranea MF3/22]